MDTAVGAVMEQVKTPALQRLWARRHTLAAVLADEPDLSLLEDIFPPAQEVDPAPSKSRCCTPPPELSCDSQHGYSQEANDVQESESLTAYAKERVSVPLLLDGAKLGDIPARYAVPTLHPHELPVVGVWVDPRVVPGFRYRVRPIGDKPLPHLFGNRALELQSIGRGYARRLTFQADIGTLNSNSNYLWSDSWPEGFAFEIEVVSAGDKFTLNDANHVAAGTVEVLNSQAPQEEVAHTVLRDGSVQKTVRLRVLCKVEWFENGQAPIVVPVNGLAVVVKPKAGGRSAVVSRIVNASVGSQQRRGFTLVAGVSHKCRRTAVRGESIGDVPTRYTVTGLEVHEMPVIGTYVDPRIVPGFCYRVRPAGSRRPLFSGRPLRLLSVGMGYGKRLTFESDPNTLNAPNNFLWSDSHPDGLGFEPRAVHAGMRFAVMADGQQLGEASVFRADAAQQEESQELLWHPNGISLVKRIHVDVTCHVALDGEPQVMRVSGTAVVAREPNHSVARLLRLENVGLASQLNMLFVTQRAALEFCPL